MAQYIHLTKNDIETIAAHYRLGVIDSAPLAGGASNTSYVLHTASGAYVLTVFENKTELEVRQMGQLLLLLAQHDFPAPRLRRTAKDDLSLLYQDQPVMLKAYIRGQVYQHLSRSMLRQIGRALARLHLLPGPDFLPTGYAYGFQLFPQVIGRQLDPAYETWLAGRYDYFRRHWPADLPAGLIHADLFYDNVLFEQHQLKAIIDFEDVCRDYLSFDLGMAILGLCRDGPQIDLGRVRPLLSGYQQVRRLAANEKRALPLLVAYAATVISYWRFWKYRIRIPSPDKADAHWRMAAVADSVAAISPAEFLELVF